MAKLQDDASSGLGDLPREVHMELESLKRLHRQEIATAAASEPFHLPREGRERQHLHSPRWEMTAGTAGEAAAKY